MNECNACFIIIKKNQKLVSLRVRVVHVVPPASQHGLKRTVQRSLRCCSIHVALAPGRGCCSGTQPVNVPLKPCWKVCSASVRPVWVRVLEDLLSNKLFHLPLGISVPMHVRACVRACVRGVCVWRRWWRVVCGVWCVVRGAWCGGGQFRHVKLPGDRHVIRHLKQLSFPMPREWKRVVWLQLILHTPHTGCAATEAMHTHRGCTHTFRFFASCASCAAALNACSFSSAPGIAACTTPAATASVALHRFPCSTVS